MAINNYTGLMGSGKSYEVVSTVILDAVKSGRRVVTNIDGIQPDKILDYLIDKKKCDPAKLGTVIYVTNDDVLKDDFFPDDEKPEQKSIVQRGDLVAIDEVWRMWGTDCKIKPNAMQFFRMHRHYTHPDTGISCDLALMIQDTSTLHRSIREVVEMTTRCVKLKAVGSPKSYRIELYEGKKVTKQTHIDTFVKRYNPDIFPLYKSYANGDGKEQAIDKRQNVLLNPRIWVTTGFMVLLCAWSAHTLYKFFSPVASKPAAANALAPTAPGKAPGTAGTVNQTASTASVSTDWRIVGRYIADQKLWFVLQNPQGKTRYEYNDDFLVKGPVITGKVDGQSVNLWSGGTGSTLPMPGTK